jgi:hypothetical protein
MEVDGKWRRQRDFKAHSADHPMMLWLPIPVKTSPPPPPPTLLICAQPQLKVKALPQCGVGGSTAKALPQCGVGGSTAALGPTPMMVVAE